MTSLRSNVDLALMAFALGAVSLGYAAGAFVLGLVLHPPGQHGWSGVEMIAVALYPLGWIGLGWGAVELWRDWLRVLGRRAQADRQAGRRGCGVAPCLRPGS